MYKVFKKYIFIKIPLLLLMYIMLSYPKSAKANNPSPKPYTYVVALVGGGSFPILGAEN